MALIAAGTVVGYRSKDYDFDGRKGTTRVLTVSTGDSTEEVKIGDDVWGVLSRTDRERLEDFGRPVIVRCTASAQDRDRGGAALAVKVVDMEWVRMADVRALGFAPKVYVEDPEEELTSLVAVPSL